MGEHIVISEGDLSPGERVLVELEGRDVGVFNVDGDYYAYTSWCPHQGGPMCEGVVSGTTAEEFDRDTLDSELKWVKSGHVLVCPWHGWQFDLLTGRGEHDERIRLPSHPVRVEDGNVIVTI